MVCPSLPRAVVDIVLHMIIYGCMIWRAIINMGYRLFGSYLVTNLERSRLFVFPSYNEVDVDVDATCRFMLTAGGNRGWGGSTTEVVMGYDINVVS